MLLSSGSALSVCGPRARPASVPHVLDLLAFAVETGRLTEACGEFVKRVVAGGEAAAHAPPAPAPATAAPDQRTVVTPTDEDAVVREVRFRKLYNEEGAPRAVACGRTPFDLPEQAATARRRSAAAALGESSRRREFPPWSGAPVFGEDECRTLEDLLRNLELARGTPAAFVQQNAVRVRREVVRALPPPARADTYKRLVRALDQRAPPEQRLFKPRRVVKHPGKTATAFALPVPSCWGRRVPAGSQLFARPSEY